jgi:hypothetical protein
MIDDTHKLLQDIVTPDLKALTTRVEALEKRVDLGFSDVKRRHTGLLVALPLEERVKRLEERTAHREQRT